MNLHMLDQINEWLIRHREEIINDLIGLVRIPSISNANSPVKPFGQGCIDALNYMFALAHKHGYDIQNYDNTIGAIRFSKGVSEIGIWTHLDVVPVPDPSEWDYPPFEGTLVDNRYLIGRGVQDNKAPAIGVFHVMNCLKDLGISFRHGFSLYMGTSEETGMDDARYFISNYTCPDLSIVPDCGFPVCTAQRGSAVLELSVPITRHLEFELNNNISVTPERITAILPNGNTLQIIEYSQHIDTLQTSGAVVTLLKSLADTFPEDQNSLMALHSLCSSIDGSSLDISFSDALSGTLRMAPTSIDCCNNILQVKLFVILPVSCNTNVLLERSQKAAQAKGVHLQQLHLRKPCLSNRDSEVVGLLTAVYNEVMHTNTTPYVMSGGNYAACLPNAFGFGPGMPGREFPDSIFRKGHGDYHQCDESEDLEHLFNFMRVYAMSLIALNELDVIHH